MDFIQVPSTFVASTTQFMGSMFTSLSAPITLILGVLLGAFVIEILIGAFRSK